MFFPECCDVQVLKIYDYNLVATILFHYISIQQWCTNLWPCIVLFMVSTFLCWYGLLLKVWTKDHDFHTRLDLSHLQYLSIKKWSADHHYGLCCRHCRLSICGFVHWCKLLFYSRCNFFCSFVRWSTSNVINIYFILLCQENGKCWYNARLSTQKTGTTNLSYRLIWLGYTFI
jgi:hypothetical protein